MLWNSTTGANTMGIKLPRHIGVIPDGNRRWARHRGVTLYQAYDVGYKRLVSVIEYLHELGINYTSVYAMSRDNCIKRTKFEKSILFKMAISAFDDLMNNKKLEEHSVRIVVLGDLTLLPVDIRRKALETVESTKDRNRGILTIALCYSGKWEVEYYTARGLPLPSLQLPPIDLLIRTGGMRRISSFLPLLLEYAELYFTDTLWPDFDREELMRALEWFSRQERRMGA